MSKTSLQRGLVVSIPLHFDGTIMRVSGHHLDGQELRMYLLFWDVLVWPDISFLLTVPEADEEFLMQVGILSRPQIAVDRGFWNNITVGIADAHLRAFDILERQEPGRWALAQGDRAFLIQQGYAEENRALLIELYRAIPVPDKDVPLADVLEFRERRYSELMRLRSEIDGLYQDVARAEDKAFALARCTNRVDLACRDLLAVTKESMMPFRLSDLKMSFDMKKIVKATAVGALGGQAFGMPLVGAAAGGVASALNAGLDLRLKGNHTSNPYWYFISFHRELFGGF
jgi:Family of unknown function (DUF6236)